MAPDQKELLSLRMLPGRLTLEQTAWLLGFREHDVPVLTASGLLKPLGNPPSNGVKYFAACDIERFRADPAWLHRASACLYRHWQHKNGSRRERPTCRADHVEAGVRSRRDTLPRRPEEPSSRGGSGHEVAGSNRPRSS